ADRAAAAEMPKLAVMPLSPKRVPRETTEILDELVLAELDSRGRYTVIGASDINAMLGLDKMKTAVGCDDLSCAAEIGGALGVQFLVAGSVSLLGDQVIISIKLLDIAHAKVVAREQVS